MRHTGQTRCTATMGGRRLHCACNVVARGWLLLRSHLPPRNKWAGQAVGAAWAPDLSLGQYASRSCFTPQ